MHRLLLVALAALLAACPPVRSGAPDDDDAAPDDDDGEDVTVEGAAAECSQNRPAGLQVEPGPEGVWVRHYAFSDGCCPETVVTASVSGRTIVAEYDLSNDFCDCICSLDVLYTLVGLGPGEWTLETPNGEAASFEL